MEPTQHLDHLKLDVDRVLALADADMGTDVAACPEWNLDQLLGHCAGVFNFAIRNIEAGPDGELQESDLSKDDMSGFALFKQKATELIGLLEQLDPAENRPNWAGESGSSFYFRRMAQELAVHRWDAQHAVGSAEPIDAELAIDGVDEFADVFVVPWAKHRGFTADGETVHLHATDADQLDGGEWMFTVHGEGVDVERAHGKGDMAVRGSASDLLLFCWNRRPLDLTTFGDTDVLEWWPTKLAI